MGHELLDASTKLSAGNSEALILYGAAPSPCVRRVIIVLLEKGLDFDWVEVDLANMEQRSPAYLGLNPNGFVPTLSHGERVIFESGVINEYLEEQFPANPLMSGDAYELAQIRWWMAAEGAMAKLFRPLMYQRLQSPVLHLSRTAAEADQIVRRSTTDATDIEWEQRVWRMAVLNADEEATKEQQLLAWLDIVEHALQGKNFLVGNQFSLADIAVYPRVSMYSWAAIAVDIQRFPNVLRWSDALRQHPSFEKSLPEQAKKLQGLAASPVLPALRKALSKAPESRSIIDKGLTFTAGKLLRKMQGVDKLLAPNVAPRTLPMPRPGRVSTEARDVHWIGGQHEGELTLFSFGPSPFCQRIALLMDQLGLGYGIAEVDIANGEHQTSDFLAMNPLGELPVLRHGDRVIVHSETIAEYLIAAFASPGEWLPGDSVQRAQHRMWLAHESGTHKELTPLWDRYVSKTPYPQNYITNEENALARVADKLGRLEHTLSQHEFLLGDTVQFADIAWYTQLQQLKAVPAFTLQGLSHIAQWDSKMMKLLTAKTVAANSSFSAASSS